MINSVFHKKHSDLTARLNKIPSEFGKFGKPVCSSVRFRERQHPGIEIMFSSQRTLMEYPYDMTVVHHALVVVSTAFKGSMESVTNDLLIASETGKHGMYTIHNDGSITPNNNGALEMFWPAGNNH